MRYGVPGTRCGLWGMGYGVLVMGYWVLGMGCGLWGMGYWVWGIGYGVWGMDVRIRNRENQTLPLSMNTQSNAKPPVHVRVELMTATQQEVGGARCSAVYM